MTIDPNQFLIHAPVRVSLAKREKPHSGSSENRDLYEGRFSLASADA